MDAAIARIEEILHSEYNIDGYTTLVREILNGAQINNAPKFCDEKKSIYASHIVGNNYIGKYSDPDGKVITIHDVELKTATYVENSRSVQRSYAKALIEAANADAAIIAYHTQEDAKWRLSFVRLDYELQMEKGRMSVVKNPTPAKRYSYLVGKDEPCHTAMSQLYGLFTSDIQPSLDDIESAFSIEKVTEQFYNEYCDKYLELKEYLDSNDEFTAESSVRGFNSEQFVKKLLGQIVFLYFIQKKGWLGVNAFPGKLTQAEYNNALYHINRTPDKLLPKIYRKAADGCYYRDNDILLALSSEDEAHLSRLVKGDPWGTGPKDFMRKIFEGCVQAGKNFFDDYLEPLFYTGLNKERGENAFFPPLHRRIPFLNGGLFEEMDGYDWENNSFNIPNEIFSNVSTKGRDADGILDIFDRYNFTMAEDEPMDKEVAIDPEMLGKVFENMLDVRDRKSKGAFYTPREIVHYMCRESLISFLSARTDIPSEDFRKLIMYGEYFREDDAAKTLWIEDKKGKRRHVFDKSRKLQIPESILSYRGGVNRLKELDGMLADVKIVDMAVGSGAFALGMLNEIVRLRDTLTQYMAIELEGEPRMYLWSSRSHYALKRATIQNCIFACDIEASAVDITKLRLWLSLVIDDEISDRENIEYGQSTKPRELPNLDCNVICGNSLLDRFNGRVLTAENFALDNLTNDRQGEMFDYSTSAMLNELIELQTKLYNEKSRIAKESLKGQIHDIYNRIVLAQLEGDTQAIDDYYEAVQLQSQPFILWQIYFPKVFKDNKGFDIVIGNPPYVQLQKAISEDGSTKLGDLYSDSGYETFTRTGDIYCLFFEKGYRLLRDNGILTFITSNKWMRAGYGESLRRFLASNTNPRLLIDFAGQKVFESATVDVDILQFEKAGNQHKTRTCTIKDDFEGNLDAYVSAHGDVTDRFTDAQAWVILSDIESSIRHKIEAVGVPLKEWDISINRGILTGYNDAFIIDTETRDALVAADPKSAEIIKPILRGRDIKRYGCEWAGLWLINTHNGVKDKGIPRIDVEDYPAIKAHLEQYYDKLAKRADKGDTPYNLRNCAYVEDFERPKIAYREISNTMDATIIEPGIVLNNKCFLITGSHLEFLLAYFNSAIFTKTIFQQMNVTGGKGVDFMNDLTAIVPTVQDERKVQGLVSQRMAASSQDAIEVEQEIERIFIDLYSLTPAERDYILQR